MSMKFGIICIDLTQAHRTKMQTFNAISGDTFKVQIR